jgi:hypothetical protein
MMGMNLSRSTRKEFLSRDPAGDKESKNAGFPNTAKTPEQNVMKKKANCTCPSYQVLLPAKRKGKNRGA